MVTDVHALRTTERFRRRNFARLDVEIAGPFTLPSAAFPGVDHDYWVYVPAQYDGKTEVSLMVFNDGATYLQADGYYRAVNVLDNLIYRRELPLMIALSSTGENSATTASRTGSLNTTQ